MGKHINNIVLNALLLLLLLLNQSLFFQNNANPKAIDGDGKTALFYAKTSGHLDVEDLLKQNGCLEINGINTNKSSNNTSNYNSLERRRNSLTSGLTYKTQQIFDKLPASII